MAEVEPQYASDYDDRTTVAVKSVLVEIGQILGSLIGLFPLRQNRPVGLDVIPLKLPPVVSNYVQHGAPALESVVEVRVGLSGVGMLVLDPLVVQGEPATVLSERDHVP